MSEPSHERIGSIIAAGGLNILGALVAAVVLLPLLF